MVSQESDKERNAFRLVPERMILLSNWKRKGKSMSSETTITTERCFLGISSHTAKAIAEVQKALYYSLAEGSEHIEEELSKVLVMLEGVSAMNNSCGRVWDVVDIKE